MGLSALLQRPLNNLDFVLKGLSRLISHYLTLGCVSVLRRVSFILLQQRRVTQICRSLLPLSPRS